MKPATLRRELALLKRMLRLGAANLPRVPLVDLPRVDNARQGFLEEGEVQAILPHLPPHARNLVEFLYLTGWRSSEALRLLWTDVNLEPALRPVQAVFPYRGQPLKKPASSKRSR